MTTTKTSTAWLPALGRTRTSRGALGDVLGIVSLLALVWWLTRAGGGSRTVLPHLFYVPILLAAVRFRALGAATAALVATVLAGPLMPLDTTTGQEQDWSWVLRGAFFVGLGQLAAWLGQHEPRSVRAAVRDHRTGARLRTALRRDEVDVHYQPIIDLRHGTVVAVEALARWTHETRGPIPPGEFIPAAERTGIVAEVDRYVMVRATRQAKEWTRWGLPVTVSINVSATRFSQPDLIDDVDDALEQSGLDARQLQIEITETAVLSDLEKCVAQISALRRRGIRIAVDDFGAGQTSLGHFHEFTADTVKLDRTFVAKAATDTQTARLLRGLVQLFDAVGASVVAEGISDESEYLTTLGLGCRLGQGFFLARPAPAADVERLLLERRRVATG